MFYIGKQFRKNTSPFSENGKKNSMYNTFETNFVCNAHKRIYFVTATMKLFLIDHFTEESLVVPGNLGFITFKELTVTTIQFL